jgi:hypothetical protein
MPANPILADVREFGKHSSESVLPQARIPNRSGLGTKSHYSELAANEPSNPYNFFPSYAHLPLPE